MIFVRSAYLEKNNFRGAMRTGHQGTCNSDGTDQPLKLHSLIKAFAIHIAPV